MKTQVDPCDPERLRLLADDRLPAAEITALEQHLEQCGACREALDRLVSADRCLDAAREALGSDLTSLYEPAGPADEPLDFLTPSDWPDSLGRLGTYEVKGVLGRGGMGVVLKAFDPALNRNVAVKVMAASLASCAAARQRFLREARAAAAVVHEHVVAVFAVVEAAGLPFLVMEYVPGRSLQDRLDRQGPLKLAEVLRIGMQTASGLAAAHAQGLVHRDVKPANILLEDGVERVRLTDFGLARAAADAAMTHSGVVAGTPHYMAPEQARGETTDHRSDLFSLGSTLYATCAGHPPFRAESALAVLRRVCDEEPRALRAINADVPAWLEAIIARLMAREASDRFQTAAEVADLLGRCLAHVQQPVSVPLPVDAIPAHRNPLRRLSARGRLAAAAVLAVALGGSGALAYALRGAWLPTTGLKSELEPGANLSAASLRVATSDEISRTLEQAWDQAQAVETGLRVSSASPWRDPVSERAAALRTAAVYLEQELAPASAPSPGIVPPTRSRP